MRVLYVMICSVHILSKSLVHSDFSNTVLKNSLRLCTGFVHHAFVLIQFRLKYVFLSMQNTQFIFNPCKKLSVFSYKIIIYITFWNKVRFGRI